MCDRNTTIVVNEGDECICYRLSGVSLNYYHQFARQERLSAARVVNRKPIYSLATSPGSA